MTPTSASERSTRTASAHRHVNGGVLPRSGAPSSVGAPPCSLSRCSGGCGRRLLQPLRSTSTAPDRLKPQFHHVRLRLYLIDHGHQASVVSLAGHTLSSVPGSGPDRHCRTGVVQGDESRWTTATPTRLARAPSVMSSWMDRLERPILPGARTPLPNPPGPEGHPTEPDASPPRPMTDLLSRSPLPTARSRGRVGFKDLLSRSPAKESAIRMPKVPSVLSFEEHPRRNRTRPRFPGKIHGHRGMWTLSTGCSQSVDKARACFILRRTHPDGAD